MQQTACDNKHDNGGATTTQKLLHKVMRQTRCNEEAMRQRMRNDERGQQVKQRHKARRGIHKQLDESDTFSWVSSLSSSSTSASNAEEMKSACLGGAALPAPAREDATPYGL